ncbi:MAG: right-handed parallel beta-helix repeat-containing protein [bacterium]|nr:right-handed parallel beta-helix repeat-containing protein [bacterium]
MQRRIGYPPRSFRWNGGVGCLILLLLAPAAIGAPFTVNSTADSVDVTPGDGICATAAATCTLRAAIQESNAFAGVHLIDFNIPLADPGYNAGTGVFTIGVGSLLDAITRAGTVIDGTTQAVNQFDTNPGLLGAGGTVGVGPDGKPGTGDEITLPQVAAPEVQVQDGATVTIGLRIQANNVTIRGLAMLGFGTTNGHAAIVISAGVSGTLIEQNVLGSTANSFTAPAAAGLRGYTGVESMGGAGGTIQNNLSGFHRVRGIWLSTGSSGWTVSGNEIRDNGVLDSTDGDGISLAGSASNDVTGNLIAGSTSQGFVVTGAGSNNNTFVNNTVTGNGVGTAGGVSQSAGITFRGSAGAGNTTLERNVIQANYGAGLQVNNGATGVRLIRNSIADNGTIPARDTSPPTGQIGIDLNSSTDDNDLGTSPFRSLNDSADGDAGGNDRLNYPVLDMATISGGNLTLTGWSRQDAVIELFIAAPDGSSFGEGQTWVATFTEGVADADSGVTLYTDPVNGINQGTDTTNRFSFTVSTPAGVGAGSQLTATGTDLVLNQTSEFGGLVTVVPQLSIVKRAFQLDGTPIADSSTLPVGMPVKFLLYIDNPGVAVSDLSLQDVLDPLFTYQTGTMKVDNTLVSSAACPGGACNETTIFSQVDGSGSAVGDGDAVAAPIDADEASYDGGARTIDLGDRINADNAQLNIGADSVWSLVFTIRMQ